MKKRGGKKKEVEPPEEEGFSGKSSGDELVAASGNSSQGEESSGGKSNSNSRRQKKNSAAVQSPSAEGSKVAEGALDAGPGREPNPVSSPKSVKFNLGGDEITVDTSSHLVAQLDNTEYFSDLGQGSGDEIAPAAATDLLGASTVPSSISENHPPTEPEKPTRSPTPVQSGGPSRDQHSSRANPASSMEWQTPQLPASWVKIIHAETQEEMYYNTQTGQAMRDAPTSSQSAATAPQLLDLLRAPEPRIEASESRHEVPTAPLGRIPLRQNQPVGEGQHQHVVQGHFPSHNIFQSFPNPAKDTNATDSSQNTTSSSKLAHLQHLLQAVNRASALQSEQQLLMKQRQPLTDTATLENDLRSELMRMMGTLSDKPSLLSDPGYSEQASKLLQLLRFGSDAGIDTYRDRSRPNVQHQPPPPSTPQFNSPAEDVQVTGYTPAMHLQAQQAQTATKAQGTKHEPQAGGGQPRPLLQPTLPFVPTSPSSSKSTHASTKKTTHASDGETATDTHAKSSKSHQSNPKKKTDPQFLSSLRKCPKCGKSNENLKGDPILHYLGCNRARKDFTPTTDELVAVRKLDEMRRHIKGVTKGGQDDTRAIRKVESEEAAARAAGTRTLGEDSSRSSSSEPGVTRNSDGYEQDSSSTDTSASSSPESSDSESVSSTSTEDAGTPPRRKKKNNPAKQQDTKSTPSSSEQSQPSTSALLQQQPSKEVANMQRQMEAFENKTNDMASLMKEMLGQLKEVKQSLSQQATPQQTPSVKPASHQSGGAAASQSLPRNTSVSTHSWLPEDQEGASSSAPSQPVWDSQRAAWCLINPTTQQRTYDLQSMPPPGGQPSNPGLGDQHFPEVEDKDLAIIGGFEKHKKAYKEYVSKCKDRQRTPVFLAQTFDRWGEWLAVVFSEQNKQRAETAGVPN
jgi:hypothetical protein